jgi:hypothetical protein
VEWYWLLGAALLGLFLMFRSGRVGRMPGDIRVSRPGFALAAPMGSSCLLSILVSVALSVGLTMCANSVFR